MIRAQINVHCFVFLQIIQTNIIPKERYRLKRNGKKQVSYDILIK